MSLVRQSRFTSVKAHLVTNTTTQHFGVTVFLGRETWLEDGDKRVGNTDTGEVAATPADIDDDLVAQLNASLAYLGLTVSRQADAS